MKLIDREPTQEMIEAMGAEVRGGSWSMTAIFNAAYDAAPEIQQEPVGYFKKYRDVWIEVCVDETDSTRLYTFPPDAQAEIAKRDARIAELEHLNGAVHTQFSKHTTIERLYEAWHRLPASPLLALIGDAIQDLQASNNEISGDIATIRQCDELLKLSRAERDKLRIERDELAAQNQQHRNQFQMILDADYRKWEDLASPDEFVRWAKSRSNHMLSLPDLASPVLNRVKAEAYREMATYFENYGPRLAIDQLRKMADAIEKGEKG